MEWIDDLGAVQFQISNSIMLLTDR